VPNGQEDWSVGRFLGTHLMGRPAPGRRLYLGQVELLVQRLEAGEITRVSIEVEPASWTLHRLDPLHIWLRSKLWLPIFRRFERQRGKPTAGTEAE
ncbi:MAG: hypothetical protein LPL00_05435, partial [Alphaproteobacteria bacterium]|nr:hypothetical protein [Alphaproteobacteria bacterium]MDX5368984.1 hypothetical protein [Alphaproteobacteria bacterium]MDX5463684.1 hypothetical protein [Alphaproteobacteria bacterium]